MRTRKISAVLLPVVLLLLVSSYFSLKVGAFSFTTGELFHFITEGGSSDQALVLHDVRIPRLFMTILVGANLAVAGALVQNLTQNPLASPSVLGINAGASFFVVGSIIFLPGITGLSLVVAGFAGGALTAALIFS
ncbi:iron chelate uptake ABC transporter family permease subunit [Bacillus sp. P14.5]|uniref:iron chelate uptake ABC transporter family permease subunit n=1 Tax=Bacillus sp. P14.5 TaxID=1983400 RepID=UPI0013B06D11